MRLFYPFNSIHIHILNASVLVYICMYIKASPVDGRVIVFGEIKDDRVEQVKGATYPITSFLGEDR